MRQVGGDLWALYAEVKVVPTNGRYTDVNPFLARAHMGAGVAKQAADRWPGLPHLLGHRLKEFGNKLYVFQVPPVHRIALGCLTVATFPTKDDWRDGSSLDLISQSARELWRAADQNGWDSILLPKVGGGLGRLDWADVEPILDDYLDDRFAVVTQKG